MEMPVLEVWLASLPNFYCTRCRGPEPSYSLIYRKEITIFRQLYDVSYYGTFGDTHLIFQLFLQPNTIITNI